MAPVFFVHSLVWRTARADRNIYILMNQKFFFIIYTFLMNNKIARVRAADQITFSFCAMTRDFHAYICTYLRSTRDEQSPSNWIIYVLYAPHCKFDQCAARVQFEMFIHSLVVPHEATIFFFDQLCTAK